jgi:Family of unknown function (DUF6499)
MFLPQLIVTGSIVMMPDASHWRSAARYNHVEKLTASGLAWEWLRRNETYNQDFDALSAQESDIPKLTEHIRQRWRLRFPSRPIYRSINTFSILVATRRHKRRRPDSRAFSSCSCW